MLQLIEGLPADVLGITATGKVTHRDYQDVLIPRAEAMLANGPIKMLYVIMNDVSGFELEALWDDGAFGLAHRREFTRVAVVSDHPWLRTALALFTPLLPGEVKHFTIAELEAAKAWISRP